MSTLQLFICQRARTGCTVARANACDWSDRHASYATGGCASRTRPFGWYLAVHEACYQPTSPKLASARPLAPTVGLAAHAAAYCQPAHVAVLVFGRVRAHRPFERAGGWLPRYQYKDSAAPAALNAALGSKYPYEDTRPPSRQRPPHESLFLGEAGLDEFSSRKAQKPKTSPKGEAHGMSIIDAPLKHEVRVHCCAASRAGRNAFLRSARIGCRNTVCAR